MKNGKTHSIPIGSLVRDVDQGDVGIVIGPLVETYLGGAVGNMRTQLVLWPCNQGEPYEMDLSALEQGWIEVISEAR